jgi:solute carrier family 35 (adenosine 3'-phospho 5'-phosphosulfate transporter), member B3
MILQGTLWESFAFAAADPSVVVKVVVSCSAGYFSITYVLKIIKGYSAVTAEIVKSIRRVVSIALSFALYSKPFLTWHAVGSVAFLVFIYNTMQAKAAKDKAKANAASLDLEEPRQE